MFSSKLQKYLAIASTIVVLGGAAFGIHEYFAKEKAFADFVAETEEAFAMQDRRWEAKNLRDEIVSMTDHLLKLKSEYLKNPSPVIEAEIRKLELIIEMKKEEYKALTQDKKGG